MATYKGILGQGSPASGVTIDLYTVPAARSATVKVVFANRITTNSKVRLSASPDLLDLDTSHYLVYDLIMPGNDASSSVVFTIQANCIVRVQSDTGGVSFTCTGIEQDQ